ncbi:neurocan core protein [Erinaceus europaeus]|uniref:Neurocan core protein n=1 Tax=Erinaceus europaeus TaxID=9365 RepID=A0ABM3WLG1_ERIEU|nr:neurocan core protein [Erinaceus europaeus]
MPPARALGSSSRMRTAWLWAWGLLLSGAGAPGPPDTSAPPSAPPGPPSAPPGLPTAVRGALAELAALPCLVTLRPGPTGDPPRVKWTRVRAASGRQLDASSLLVAQGRALRVAPAWRGRVSLPAFLRHPHNATLLLGPLRSSDAGLYRCQAVRGLADQQRLVALEVAAQAAHQNHRNGGTGGRKQAQLGAPRHKAWV